MVHFINLHIETIFQFEIILVSRQIMAHSGLLAEALSKSKTANKL